MDMKFLELGFFIMLYNLMNVSRVSGGGIDSNIEVSLELNFYSNVCPEAEAIIFSWVQRAAMEDPRMPASLLRLHFHDCFVNGCDASVLLDDVGGFVGEKSAAPNLNSLRGFEVIDAIKSEIEAFCPQTVSCADILAIAARDSVVVVIVIISKISMMSIVVTINLVLCGGPSWEVPMGRRDSLTASKEAANNNIPSPNSTVSSLLSKFETLGLDIKDLIALSGAHTMGNARCSSFTSRLALQDSDGRISPPEFIQSLRDLCFENNVDNNNNILAELDVVTPTSFDNQYYVNLLSGEGVLESDHVLANGDDQTARDLVITYAEDPFVFFNDFKDSMLKLGSIAPSNAAVSGEIRTSCRSVNYY